MGGFGGVIRHGAGQVQGRSAQVATSGAFNTLERLATGARTAARGQARPRPTIDEDPGLMLWNPDQESIGVSQYPPYDGRWAITVSVNCGFQIDFATNTLGPLLPDDRGATDLLAGWRYVQLSANGVTFSATVQPGQIVPVTGADHTFYADLTTTDDVAAVAYPSGGGGPGIEVVVVDAYVTVRGLRLGPISEPEAP